MQLLRKRISVSQFIKNFLHEYQLVSSVTRALFESLNSQKICYSLKQITNLLASEFIVKH